ncbi:MAG: exodeoxyribonuclease VII small subunit [Acidimicrobiia bacterium]|nr:exodeoxyribonuclease VII small subunit [Acidimicrobiia bacterium]
MTESNSLGYTAAMEELEQILQEIEADDVDVDVLTDRVARAAELIRTCRERIASTRTEVERVVTELDGEGT